MSGATAWFLCALGAFAIAWLLDKLIKEKKW